ncbi:anti-sigma factor domain-containing protein [Nesterenkonia muleiensis]|uniref:anti-sigma factor n=1 Tax=Nesterenkonia muleiensis TaxID=2282648 RepID=UPI000E73E729|nr:anti-sigma factor [Nesterenkonia muleiensis]
MNGREDALRELLGAWALDAVDDVERARVERAIAADPELAAEARQLRETVARIAEADAQQPPEDLREAVLAQIDTFSPRTTRANRPTAETSERDQLAAVRRRRRWQTLAAAAAAVIAVAIPTAIAVDQADRADQAEQQAQQAQHEAGLAQQQADQIAQALTDPAAQMVAEELPDGSRAVAVLGEGTALFAAEGMTELHDQDYQLWVLEGDHAIPAGVLAWEAGRLTAHVEDFPEDAALAVTAEPLGGSEQPTSDPMVVLAPQS